MGVEQAVENPMAREIVAACGRLGLDTLFEPAKCHPKNWANPGRVKIKLKGASKNVGGVKNSLSSYLLSLFSEGILLILLNE